MISVIWFMNAQICDISRQLSLELEASPALGVEEEPGLDGLAGPRVRLHLARVVVVGALVAVCGSRPQHVACLVALGQRLEVVGVAPAAAVGKLDAAAPRRVEVPSDSCIRQSAERQDKSGLLYGKVTKENNAKCEIKG